MAEIENNNDPLERFFKNHLSDYDINYNEQDWQELEKRLDLADEKYAYTQRTRWIAAAAVLLFCFLAYFTYQNYSSIEQISDRLTAETIPEMKQNTGEEVPQQADSQPEDKSTAGEITTRDDSDQGNASGNLSTSTSNQLQGITADRTTGNRSLNGSSPQATRFLETTYSAEIQYVSAVPCTECTSVSSQIEEEPTVYLASASYNEEKAGKGDRFGNRSLQEENTKIRSDTSFPLALGFVLGPDLSTVGSISNFENPGYKIGFRVELNLGSRLALTTGLVHSNVRYTAQGREYKPPGGYWTNGVVARETFAECALIDIPVTLKYDFLQFESSRLFATAGLSSYIMLNEDYRFRYDSGNPNLTREWSGKTGTRHWFSNASFSIGYEFDLLPNWSIQAEPFVRLPLKEVGWGNVKLYSVGSFISFNYKLK